MGFFFACMEYGILSMNPLTLHHHARQGKKSAQSLLGYVKTPEKFLWVTLFGSTLANFVSALLFAFCAFDVDIFCKIKLSTPLEKAESALIILSGAIVIYILCDFLPKMLTKRSPYLFCVIALPVFRVAYWFLYPIVTVTLVACKKLIWKSAPMSYGQRVLGEKMRFPLLLQNYDPDITSEERGMVDGVMNFSTATVKDNMVPINKVETLPIHSTVAKVREYALKTGKNYIPLITDASSHITAVVSLKSLLYQEGIDDSTPIDGYAQPITTLGENTKLYDAMRAMQKNGCRIALVTNESCNPVGIVTMQNILKTIFGTLNL